MTIIKNIIQRVRPVQQKTVEPAADHPNFWMFH